MLGVVELKWRLREPDNPPTGRGTPCTREQLRIASRVREANGLSGGGRPVVQPSEALRKLRRVEHRRVLEKRQPSWWGMCLHQRMARLLSNLHRRTGWRRMPPQRSRAFGNPLEQFHRGLKPHLIQGEFRMDVEQWLASG